MAGTTRGEGESPEGDGVHPAVVQARRVVGLYGDPRVSWSILLELDLAGPLAVADVQRRLSALVARSPHLGPVAAVEADPPSWDDLRTRFAEEPFADRAPLVRVAVSSAPSRLLVAAHHGALDGLGLLGLAGELVGYALGSNARGLARTGSEAGFVRGTAARLREIALRPPERFAGSARLRAKGSGEVLVAEDLPVIRRGTAALAWAGLVALRAWNGSDARARQPVAAIGVSRRPGAAPVAPTRDTAFSRLHLAGARVPREVSRLLEETPPEPDFPQTEGGRVGRAASRLASTVLGPRLGASFLASNLGLVDGGRLVTAARFWPSASGPAGVALGLVTVGSTTSVTVRARRPWFGEHDAARMLGLVVDALRSAQ